MAVADRNGLIADSWTLLADDAAPAAGGAVVVSLARLKSDHNALFAAAKSVGVEVTGESNLDELEPFLPRLGLAVVRFTAMRDGRPFSIGKLLRERLGFKAEIRAAGPFIPDQALFLLRVGFNSFEVDANFPLESLKRSVAAYTAWYQRGVDRSSPTVVQIRHGAKPAPDQSDGNTPTGGAA